MQADTDGLPGSGVAAQQLAALQQLVARQPSGPQFDFQPGGLPVDAAFTHVRPLRKDDELPAIAEAEAARLKAWVEKASRGPLVASGH